MGAVSWCPRKRPDHGMLICFINHTNDYDYEGNLNHHPKHQGHLLSTTPASTI